MRLPDLVWILVLVERKKLFVRLESGLGLIQFIVAERADKPLSRTRCFGTRNQFEGLKSGGIISGEVVGGAEILPVRQILVIELQRGLNLLFGAGKIALLHVDAAEAFMELSISGGHGDGFLKSDDGVVPLFLGDLNVGASAQGIERGRLAGIGAVEFGKSFVIVFLIEQQMNQASASGAIGGVHGEILAIGGEGFGLLLRFESFREATQSFRRFWLGIERSAILGFGLRIFFHAVIEIAEVHGGLEVERIESESGFVGFGGAGDVAGAFEGVPEQEAGPALRGEEFDGFFERRDSGSGIVVGEEDSEIQISLGHFRVEGDGAFVFGASIGGALKSGVGVGQLEVGPSEIRLRGNQFLERSDRRLVLLGIHIVLGFLEKIVQGIREGLRARLAGILRRSG